MAMAAAQRNCAPPFGTSQPLSGKLLMMRMAQAHEDLGLRKQASRARSTLVQLRFMAARAARSAGNEALALQRHAALASRIAPQLHFIDPVVALGT